MTFNCNIIHYSYFHSMQTVFGDSEDGKRRLYQTADVVLLLINYGMKGEPSGITWGVCQRWFRAPGDSQRTSRIAILTGSYGKNF